MELLTIYDYIGFIGVIILMYTLTCLNLKDNYKDKPKFYIQNILGSIFLMVSDIYRESWFSVGIGFFWILTSFFTLKNQMRLPDKYLKNITNLALTYFAIGFLMNFFKDDLENSIFNCIGMISTGLCVILFAKFSAGNLSLLKYLIIGIFIKILMMMALYNNFNMASISVQAYSIFIALFGIYKEIKFKKYIVKYNQI